MFIHYKFYSSAPKAFCQALILLNIENLRNKFLQLTHPKHSKQLASKIQALRQNSVPNDSKKIDKYLRVDRGEYHIIYL